MNVLEMLNEMQAKAKAANGRLDDLALPKPLFDMFLKQLQELGHAEEYKEGDDIMYNGTRVHTGDND